jgi:hypothetical protein
MQPLYRTPVGKMTPWRCCGRTPNASFAGLLQKDAEGHRPTFAPILAGAEHPTFESINRLAREYELKEYSMARGRCARWNWCHSACKF